MRTSMPIALLLLLLLPFAQASVLSVKVVVDQDTPSVGAPVSLITGGIELSTGKADSNGMVRFNASDGSYFISVGKSSIYPQYIVFKELSGDSSITIVRRQLINYANVYGQITGPTDFANTTAVAYMNGQIVKRAPVNKGGFYLMSFLPEGTYEIRFESPGFEPKRVQILLPSSEFTPLYVELLAPKPPEEQPTSISSPYQVQQFAPIEVVLSKGGVPLAGQEISVSTPSGKTTVKTDPQGIARVNAAEGGAYSFSFGNMSSSTMVAVAEVPAPKENKSAGVPVAPSVPAGPGAAPQAPSSGNGALLPLAIGLALFMLAVLVAIAVSVAKIAGSGGKKNGSAEAKHAGPHQHGAAGAKEHGQGSHPQDAAHAKEHGHSHPHHSEKSGHKGK